MNALAPPALVLAFLAMTGNAGPPTARPTNRLAGESSPYLLQHQHNPVDWYPWGAEALEKAKSEDKPIFLSIGYSTCHWCHVMERESFENAEIAALLNASFVSIKVDREERPDLDNVYMTACQLMTHSGGWPLTAILTPDGLPFFTGTYFPPDDRFGRAGMRTLLPRLAEAWKKSRPEIEQHASQIAGAVQQAIESPPEKGAAAPLDARFGDALFAELGRRFDERHGGFSDAPKFPPHGALEFLLSRCRGKRDPEPEKMLRRTLDAMQDGGVFDQVGGGFHRYSVDGEWFIPHFEKMLYDNAQLLGIYADAAALFGDRRYRETALRTFEWMEREMRMPEGGYASALDADSEGVEGKYYLWSVPEIDAVLGKDESPLYREAFDIQAPGNTPPQFEEGHGKNLPRRVISTGELAKKHGLPPSEIDERLSRDQRKLEVVRSNRVPPFRDDKVLTSWNALAVSALVRASHDLREPALLAAARRVTGFLVSKHVSGTRVLHVSRGGAAKIDGFLEDYALLARALLDLSDSTGDTDAGAEARRIAGEMLKTFSDSAAGGFFQTAAKGKRGLLDSSKEFLDQVVPSPNGVAAEVLRRLDARENSSALRLAAERTLEAAAPYARTFPTAATTFAMLSNALPAAPAAAPARAQAGPVIVEIVAPRAPLQPEAEGSVAVRFEIERGWHIQSHRPSRPDLVATAIRPGGEGLAFGEPAYPSGAEVEVAGEKLSTYSGEFEVRIPVRPSSSAPRAVLAIEFQACDDRRCLAPSRLEIGAALSLAK